jgi:AraC family transcriptional regulator of adaptative response/methylated-DNA-[protein]-cysteine methyltransferase
MDQFQKVTEAIQYMTDNYRHQPSLMDVAREVHQSEYHFQRVFSEWVGISPKKFLKYLTVESLKSDLKSVPDLHVAAELVGMSSPSRIHELFVTMEAVTPAQYRSGGAGLKIHNGFAESLFGDCFVATTDRGICAISFADGNREEVLGEFKAKWPAALLIQHDDVAVDVVKKMNSLFDSDPKVKAPTFHLLVKGTPFQVKVWEALLKIPSGMVTSYQGLASAIGNPTASRAVGSAVGKNPVSWLIPCHRVIRQEGIIGNYHWGTLRKTAMIGLEKTIVGEIQLLELLLEAYDAQNLSKLTLTPHGILRLLMDEHNLTQRDMAKISGLSKSYLSEILSGKKGIPKNAIAKFSKHFKIRQEVLNPVI